MCIRDRLLTDTQLKNELIRTNKTSSGTAFIENGSINLRKYFDFPVVTNTTYYGEVGWSPYSSSGFALFSKTQMVDKDGNVGLLQINYNQYVKIVYTLQIVPSFPMPTYFNPSIANWSAEGLASNQLVGLMTPSGTGQNVFFDSAQDMSEPSKKAIDIFVSTNTSSPSGYGTGTNYSAGGSPQRASLSSYVSGAYTKSFYANFSRGSGVGDISVIGCGLTGSSSSNPIFAHKMNAPQTKASNYELEVFMNHSWGRI